MKRLSLPLLVVSVLGSCTHSGPSFEETEIIERMEGYDETPMFATGRKTMWTEDKDAIFANIILMSGNTRPDACMKAASLGAKTAMLKYIKEQVTTSGQLAEDSAQEDPGYESLTAFLSQGSISGAKVIEQYYDRREVSEASGARVLKLKCAAKISVNKNHLAKQLREATNKGPKGNKEVRKKLIEAQKNFIENL